METPASAKCIVEAGSPARSERVSSVGQFNLQAVKANAAGLAPVDEADNSETTS